MSSETFGVILVIALNINGSTTQITLKPEQFIYCEEQKNNNQLRIYLKKGFLEILNEEKYECLCYCIIDAIIATYGHDSLQFKIFSNNLELSYIPLLQNKKPKKSLTQTL